MAFDDLDCREFILGEENGFSVVMYQAEILRLIKVLETLKSPKLAQKFKRIIFIRDYVERTKTDFNKEIQKGDILNFILSERDLKRYIDDQRDFDKTMREYYGKNI